MFRNLKNSSAQQKLVFDPPSHCSVHCFLPRQTCVVKSVRTCRRKVQQRAQPVRTEQQREILSCNLIIALEPQMKNERSRSDIRQNKPAHAAL